MRTHINKRQAVLLSALLLLLTSSVRGGIVPSKAQKELRPTVILISLDGFRSDYLEKYAPPNLKALARAGVQAKWMTPSFPSKTFPNHYTIATGLYPQHHGIVENSVFDKSFNAVFGMGNRKEVQNGRWWLGEPIWITAEKQGQKSAPFFFPGSEAEIEGRRPAYWKPFDDKMPNDDRVNTVLSWLDLPLAERPTFLTLYFSDVDEAGHRFGPDSAQTRDAVLKVDKDIGRLIAGLQKREVFTLVNLIVVSDHGMAAVNLGNAVVLDDLFDTNLAERVLWAQEIVSIFPKEGNEDAIYAKLKAKLPPHAKIYRKSEVPARYHYSDSPRIAPLLVLPDEGWIVTSRARFVHMKLAGDTTGTRGEHGYDNQLPSMRAIFIAQGPAFKRGVLIEPFPNVDVYNLMTSILGLKPAPNDGDYSLTDAALVRPPRRN